MIGVRTITNERRRVFAAIVTVERRRTQVGLWPTQMEAALARDRFVLHLGLNYRLNFPEKSRKLGSASAAELRVAARAARGTSPACPYAGVCRDFSPRGGWNPTLMIDGRARKLGRFDSAEQAALFRERAVVHYYGPASRYRNFPTKKVAPASIDELRLEHVRARRRAGDPRAPVSDYDGVRIMRRVGADCFLAAVRVGERSVSGGYWPSEREAAIARDRLVLHFRLGKPLNIPAASRKLGPGGPLDLARAARAARRRAGGKSSFEGVVRPLRGGAGWLATVRIGAERHFVGRFDTPLEAALWRERAAAYYSHLDVPRNFPDRPVKPASVDQLRREYLVASKQGMTSKYFGVTRSGAAHHPWRAAFEYSSTGLPGGSRLMFLGSWKTPKAAAEAYDRAALYYVGRGAILNFPDRRDLEPASAEDLWAEARRLLKATKSSPFRGVCWSRQRQRWEVHIARNKRQYFLGLFDDEVEAAHRYDREAKRLFGSKARLNFHPKTGQAIYGRRDEGQRPPRAARHRLMTRRG